MGFQRPLFLTFAAARVLQGDAVVNEQIMDAAQCKAASRHFVSGKVLETYAALIASTRALTLPRISTKPVTSRASAGRKSARGCTLGSEQFEDIVAPPSHLCFSKERAHSRHGLALKGRFRGRPACPVRAHTKRSKLTARPGPKSAATRRRTKPPRAPPREPACEPWEAPRVAASAAAA